MIVCQYVLFRGRKEDPSKAKFHVRKIIKGHVIILLVLYAQVKSFETKADVDVWLFSNPMYCPGALHFVERNASVISYGIQTNSTPVAKRGQFEDPTFKFQIPLQIAAEREIARSLIGGTRFCSQ